MNVLSSGLQRVNHPDTSALSTPPHDPVPICGTRDRTCWAAKPPPRLFSARRTGVRTMTFDETNAKILALLQRDSSLTNEAIGSEVNLSSTAVIKRVKKLRDSGV